MEPPRDTRHRVRRGETLSAIARKHGVSVEAIKQANNLRGSVIHPGVSLVIPRGGSTAVRGDRRRRRDPRSPRKLAERSSDRDRCRLRRPRVHTVKSGDTLWGVARQHGVTVPALAAANGLTTRAS